jgi:predicted nucleic acid-binding protein
MNVLVDTSVWVAHFRKANADLAKLLVSNQVLGHPLVLAEIACGTPPSPREQTLGDLALIGQAHAASFTEIMTFIESEKLYGLGCGFVDIALLASACITPNAKLWTHDKKLMRLAKRLNVDFKLAVH